MRAVISGSGIAGLALAQSLVTRGWGATLVERAAGPRDAGYMIDFFGLGYEAAERMGILPRLREAAYEVGELVYVDASGRRRAGLDYGRFAHALDGRLLSLMRADLESVLRAEVGDAVEIRYGRTITRIHEKPAEVVVELSDGRTLRGDVLVGADGIHSRIRALAFGPEERCVRHLGLHAAAYTFDSSAVRADLDGRFALTDSCDRMMGFYGLGGDRVAAFGVHRDPSPRLPDDARATLRERYASLGWVVPSALAACPASSELYYDVVAQVELARWCRDRVALVGDACGAVSLVAGQGASLAVAGAHVLGAALAAGPSVPEALARYEQRWRPLVTAKQQVGREGLEWFLPSTMRRLVTRRVALRLMRVPVIDRYLIGALVGIRGVSLDDLGV